MSRQEDTPINETPNVERTGDPTRQQAPGGTAASQATESARDTAQSAQDTASQFMEQGRDRVTAQLGQQKLRLASGLGSISEAIRSASQSLRDQQQTGVARVADEGANRIDQLTQHLQDRDVNELLGEAERYARQQPAVFLGAAFGLGMLASRFLKSSGHEANRPHS